MVNGHPPSAAVTLNKLISRWFVLVIANKVTPLTADDAGGLSACVSRRMVSAFTMWVAECLPSKHRALVLT